MRYLGFIANWVLMMVLFVTAVYHSIALDDYQGAAYYMAFAVMLKLHERDIEGDK